MALTLRRRQLPSIYYIKESRVFCTEQGFVVCGHGRSRCIYCAISGLAGGLYVEISGVPCIVSEFIVLKDFWLTKFPCTVFVFPQQGAGGQLVTNIDENYLLSRCLQTVNISLDAGK